MKIVVYSKFMKELNKRKYFSAVMVRYAVSMIFIFFGVSQIIYPKSWTAWLPGFVFFLPISPQNFIILNGFSEAFMGVLLAFGVLTRVNALLIGFKIIAIILLINGGGYGINNISLRDLALAIAAFAVFVNGPDAFCLDNKMFPYIKKKFNL